jgi:hypothetical protein
VWQRYIPIPKAEKCQPKARHYGQDSWRSVAQAQLGHAEPRITLEI